MDYLYRTLLVLLYLVLSIILVSTAVGIPGTWILFGTALIVAVVSHFSSITLGLLLVCLALASAGEITETFLGSVVIANRGGSRIGIAGTMLGGFAGVILGAPHFFPIGSIVFGFLGAFLGAVIGEFISYRSLDSALRIGFWAFVGRLGAVFVKICMGGVILWIIITRTWP